MTTKAENRHVSNEEHDDNDNDNDQTTKPQNLKSSSVSSQDSTPDEPPQFSEREQKFFNLRAKLSLCRHQNLADVREEAVRQRERPGLADKKRKMEAEQQKKKEEDEMRKNGKDPDREKLLLVSAEEAEWATKKKKPKKNNVDPCDKGSSETHYYAYKRRSGLMGRDDNEYQKAKESQSDFYRDAHNLNYGKAPKIPQKNVDRMVDELDKSIAKRDTFRRRRTYYEDADIDYINERNRVFNQKISRAFDKYTSEIKQNLERGTAI